MDKLIMSRKEREQLKVFEKLEAGEITQVIAGQMLNMSDRNIRKKIKRYREKSDSGLIHQSRGRPSHKCWGDNERAMAMNLLRTKWTGFGPTFAAEKLEEFEGIKVSRETLRKAMIVEGLWAVGNRKQQYRQRRDRKLVVGVLVQLDGSPHDWFEGRGPRCTLLVFIDDATSRILWLEFVESESFEGVAKATKKYIERWGRPVAFYVDFGSVFKVNLNNPEGERKTQYERILGDLDIDLSHATSPQAKGRVERCNKTMQDRLIKEMRLAGISSMDEANRFVQQGDFIEKHNARFAVPPAKEGDAHRAIQGYDLYKIFCSKDERIVTSDFTVSYKGRILQLAKDQPATIRPKDHVTICQHLDEKITVRIRSVQLNFKEIGMRKQKKLTPVEYVSQENALGIEEGTANIPLEGLLDDLYNQRHHPENRNFSRC
jgi:hypothetical protein